MLNTSQASGYIGRLSHSTSMLDPVESLSVTVMFVNTSEPTGVSSLTVISYGA